MRKKIIRQAVIPVNPWHVKQLVGVNEYLETVPINKWVLMYLEEEVTAAVEIAGAADYLRRLADQYNTEERPHSPPKKIAADVPAGTARCVFLLGHFEQDPATRRRLIASE